MQPSRAIFNQMVSLWANNTALLAIADPNTILLGMINAEFTPSPNLVMTDIHLQTTQLDYSVLPVADASPIIFNDCVSSERVVTFAGELGNWQIEATSVGSTFTIYGTALMSNDHATLLAVEHLPVNLTFASNNQGGEVPGMTFRFPPTMVR